MTHAFPKRLSINSRIHRDVMDLPRDEPKRAWKASLIRANIPQEFWHLTLRQFKGDRKAASLTQIYCDKMDEAYKKGIGFLFTGSNGVGKTTLLTIILKKALRKGYSAFYMSISEVFARIYRTFEYPALLPELHTILQDTQFLVIGELGKDFHRESSQDYAISEFDSIFRYRRGRNLPTLMDTNLVEEELEDTYGESLISLFRSRTKIVEVKGEDFREVQYEEVEDLFT